MRHFLVTVQEYKQELNFLMCCSTSNELQNKFEQSTYSEFTGGLVEISEISKWEYNQLKNYVLTTHYDDAPEYRLKRKLCYQIASPFNYNGNQWTRIAQSKMNSLYSN